MALAAQALEAQKASKPLEQGGALEQVAARIKRVMGLTFDMRGAQKAQPFGHPLDGRVRRHSGRRKHEPGPIGLEGLVLERPFT